MVDWLALESYPTAQTSDADLPHTLNRNEVTPLVTADHAVPL
jgi:hypothetical protein